MREARPIIPKTFNVPGMLRMAAGEAWEIASPRRQAALIDAFSPMITANYANRFDAFNGERLRHSS
jgi:phospholipid transport system substrate-binding protein